MDIPKNSIEASIKHSLRGQLLSKVGTLIILIIVVAVITYISYSVMIIFDTKTTNRIPMFYISGMLSFMFWLLSLTSGLSLFNPHWVIKVPLYKEYIKWRTFRMKELERLILEANEKGKEIEAEQKKLTSELIMLQ